MGLVGRAIEAEGIATVALSLVREITEKTPPPRALLVRFPFGHALGEAGRPDQQHHILFLALRLLFEAAGPGTLRDSGLRWRRSAYPPADWEAFRALGPVRGTAAGA